MQTKRTKTTMMQSVRTNTNEAEEQLATSAGAAIVSSVHDDDSSSSVISQEPDSSVFLSVTPSMLNSSDFDKLSSSEEQQEEPGEESWYDPSTFETVGASLFAGQSEISDSGSRDSNEENKKCNETEPQTKVAEDNGQLSTLEFALQAGTIVAGAVGIFLILAGLGGHERKPMQRTNSIKNRKF